LVVNEPAKYVISIDNLSKKPASTISVRCALPVWVELDTHVASSGKLIETQPDIVWHIENIGGQEHQELALQLVPREGKAFDLRVDISAQPSNVQKRIEVKQPRLDVALEGPKALKFSEPAIWNLTVSNPGTGDLSDVSIDVFSGDEKLASQTLSHIPAGGEQPIALQINPTKAGTHSVRVVGKAGRLSDSAKASFFVRRGRLAVDLVGARRDFAGAASKYTVKLHNDGDDQIQNVLVSLNLPEGMQYLSGIENPSITTTGVSWVVNRVDVDEQSEFPISLVAKKGGTHEIQVTASTMDRMTASDSIAIDAITAPDIKLEVKDPVGPRSVDSVAEYVICVLNHGTDTARDISVIAVCDSNLEPVDVSGSAALRDGKVYFKPVKTLEPSHKVTFKVKAKAKVSGNHDFRVIVKSVVPETRLAVQETTRFFDMDQYDSEKQEAAEVDNQVADDHKPPKSSLLQPLSFEPHFQASDPPVETVR